jgi:hypothetical protein
MSSPPYHRCRYRYESIAIITIENKKWKKGRRRIERKMEARQQETQSFNSQSL